MAKDYYKILEVDKNASKEEIKKAYKKLAKKYHPDISKEPDSEQKFKDINEAAGVLLDDQKKKNYDTYGSAEGPAGFGGGGYGSAGAGGFDPRDFGINLDDIFEQFGFGGGGGFGDFGFGGGSRRSRRRDTSIHEEIEITLEDVYFGCEKDIKINRSKKCETCDGVGAKSKSDVETCRTCNGTGVVIETKNSFLGMIKTQKTCPDCMGSGEKIINPCNACNGNGSIKEKETVTIKIPKGVETGVTLKVSGKGDYDKDSREYGDLYVRILVRKDKDLDVDGMDLYKTLDINFIQAIIGDEIEFKHFGKTLALKIPEGTQPSTVLKLKGKGLPHFNYSTYGDLYIKIDVEIPTKTTNKQKEILMDYAKTMKDKSVIDRLKSFFK